jgi:hypothetical protein
MIQGLDEKFVDSKNEIFNLLAEGEERRKMAATNMNATSSRSHVFSIVVYIKDDEEMFKTGKLNLVDLAGKNDIQSLITLGHVITGKIKNKKKMTNSVINVSLFRFGGP